MCFEMDNNDTNEDSEDNDTNEESEDNEDSEANEANEANEDSEANEANEANEDNETNEANEDSEDREGTGIQKNRVVEERGGRVVVTITYTPVLDIGNSCDAGNDVNADANELREIVETSHPHEDHIEETTEFADLLHKNE